MAGSSAATRSNLLALPSLAGLALRWALQHRETAEEWPANPRAQAARALHFPAYRNDPLAWLLVGKLNLSSMGLGALCLCLLVLLLTSAPFLYQEVLPQSRSAVLTWFSREWAWMLANLVSAAVVPAFYTWSIRATGRLFAQLYQDGAVQSSERTTLDLVVQGEQSLQRHICDPRWTWGAAAVTAALAPLWMATGVGGRWAGLPHLGADYWLLAATLLPLQTMLIYMFVATLLRQAATVGALYRFFNPAANGDGQREPTRVRPWHPDRCGGLGQLNNFAVNISYFTATCGFGLVMWTYTSIHFNGVLGSVIHDPTVWILAAAYLAGAPVLFFLTLGSAHRAMRRDRTEHLRAISEQLDAEYRAIRGNMAGDAASVTASVDKIKHLQEVYDLTAKFPVWPFNIASMERFIATVGSPIIVGGTVAVSIEFFKRVAAL